MQATGDAKRRTLLVYAAMVSALYAAVLIAGYGILSLVLDRDVVAGGHSILVGLVMPSTAIVLVAAACAWGSQLVDADPARSSSVTLTSGEDASAPSSTDALHAGRRSGRKLPLGAVLAAATAAWLGSAIAGGLVVLVEAREAFAAARFIWDRLGDPFGVFTGVSALCAMLAFALIAGSVTMPSRGRNEDDAPPTSGGTPN